MLLFLLILFPADELYAPGPGTTLSSFIFLVLPNRSEVDAKQEEIDLLPLTWYVYSPGPGYLSAYLFIIFSGFQGTTPFELKVDWGFDRSPRESVSGMTFFI